MYFDDKNKSDDFVKIVIIREIHLIKDLKTNWLIKNDILKLKFIDIFISINPAYIESCDVPIFIVFNARFKSQHMFVHSFKTTTILFEIKYVLRIHNITLSKRNYLFKLTILANLLIYAYIINLDTKFILIRDENSFSLQYFEIFD